VASHDKEYKRQNFRGWVSKAMMGTKQGFMDDGDDLREIKTAIISNGLYTVLFPFIILIILTFFNIFILLCT
jgi:hypothetical protein